MEEVLDVLLMDALLGFPFQRLICNSTLIEGIFYVTVVVFFENDAFCTGLLALHLLFWQTHVDSECWCGQILEH